jgi:hypothetical protein
MSYAGGLWGERMIGPFTAQPSGGKNNWWYVANREGLNVLAFESKPGAKFTDEKTARSIAEKMCKEAGVAV